MIDAEKAETEEKAEISISRMADLLGVSRSGYYAWAARQGSSLGRGRPGGMTWW